MTRKKIQKSKNNLNSSSAGRRQDDILKSKKNGRFLFLTKIPTFICLLIIVWGLLYFLYGDLLFVAEQRSFFAFNSTAMQYFLCQPLGWLYVVGRFMLLSCCWPLLGSLVIALMLTISAWLLDRAFNLRGWGHLVSVSFPFLYFVYFFYMGLNLVYLRELSWIMTVPLIPLFISIIIAIVAKLLKKTTFTFSSFWKNNNFSSIQKFIVLYMLFLMVCCIAVAVTYS